MSDSSAKINPLWDCAKIVEACEAITGRAVRAGQDDCTLYVDVPQDVLDLAVKTVDQLAAARERKLYQIRTRRDSLLAKTDWVVLRALEQNVFTEYRDSIVCANRAALRDLLNAAEAALARITTLQEIHDFEPDWPVES